jgi:hypothetical protein
VENWRSWGAEPGGVELRRARDLIRWIAIGRHLVSHGKMTMVDGFGDAIKIYILIVLAVEIL